MTTDVRVIPSQSARIRAAHAAYPDLSPPEIAKIVGLQPRVVRIALTAGDTLRRKSVAK